MIKVKDSEPFPYVIMSCDKMDCGLPSYQHVLMESAQTEEQALVYATRRAREGRWVHLFRELYYHTGKPDDEEDDNQD